MTKAEIILKAQLYIDDTSELSTAEFSDLFDKMYNKINTSRTWEGTKKAFTGTTTAGIDYVALPTDFLYLTANHNYTDSSYEAGFPVIFRGVNFSPVQVVSWSDRRQYRNNNGYAYIDIGASRLYFAKAPTATEAIEYDYHGQKAALTDLDSPWFPLEFHDAIYHYMVSDDYMIQQSDKAKSYAKENRAAGDEIMERMEMWNANLVQI